MNKPIHIVDKWGYPFEKTKNAPFFNATRFICQLIKGNIRINIKPRWTVNEKGECYRIGQENRKSSDNITKGIS